MEYTMDAGTSGNPTFHLLSESLELCIHTVLYCRQLYPASIFAPVTFLGLQIHVCRHDKINKYISDTVRVASEGILRGDIDSVVLTFFDEEANRFGSLREGGTLTRGSQTSSAASAQLSQLTASPAKSPR